MQVLNEPIRPGLVASVRRQQLNERGQRVTQLSWVLDQLNHPGGVKTLRERGLVVVYGFAEAAKPGDDDRAPAARERDQHAAYPRVGDDEPGAANVLDELLEGEEVDATCSFGPNGGGAMLDDELLIELEVVDSSYQPIEGRLIRADRYEYHCEKTPPSKRARRTTSTNSGH